MRAVALAAGWSAVRRRPRAAVSLLLASAPEAAPSLVSGLAVAGAVDRGFAAGRPLAGLGWLGLLVLAALAGGFGARQGYRRLADLVEPFRDELVERVVTDALRDAVRSAGAAGASDGASDGGAVARLTQQIEIVRDSFAGLVMTVRGFALSASGAVVGLFALAPSVAAAVLPPFAVGLALYAATLRRAARRQREYVLATEELSERAGTVLAAGRDLTAAGQTGSGAALLAGPVDGQAATERALARVTAARTLCLGIGGRLPLVTLLAAAPFLVGRGLTAGAVLGGLTYVAQALHPALNTLVQGLGVGGLRMAVTLDRLLAHRQPEAPADAGRRPVGHRITVRGLDFRYGAGARPVLRGLDLDLAPGEHLAVVGPSGVGKSTLVGLLCGLLPPDAGTVLVGGTPAAGLPARMLAGVRVLIPQQAFVFGGTVGENLRYLRPGAPDGAVHAAVRELGAEALVRRLGGFDGRLDPAALSAGERQLLALVRAYLADAPVTVLDEASCHLAPAAERRVEEAFAARTGAAGGTLVVVAHRLSSALRARRVLVMDGAAVAVGSHRDLVARVPLYRELWGSWRSSVPDVDGGGAGAGCGSDPPGVLGDADGRDTEGSGAGAGRGSDPTGVLGDADGLDAGAGAGLGDGAGQVVADGSAGQTELVGDVGDR